MVSIFVVHCKSELYVICQWLTFLFYCAGTERCNEALQKLDKKYDVVVNIQGDEPLIEPEIIDGIVKSLQVNLYIFIIHVSRNMNNTSN